MLVINGETKYEFVEVIPIGSLKLDGFWKIMLNRNGIHPLSDKTARTLKEVFHLSSVGCTVYGMSLFRKEFIWMMRINRNCVMLLLITMLSCKRIQKHPIRSMQKGGLLFQRNVFNWERVSLHLELVECKPLPPLIC